MVWDINKTLTLAASAVSSYDLNSSLPPTVKRGGRFNLSANGSALPVGVALSAAGILSSTVVARLGTVTGVVFSYDEP